ncbi:MAG: hypothetical protein ACR650_07535 [Methylocystis sp.]|jgi:hypothetical protein
MAANLDATVGARNGDVVSAIARALIRRFCARRDRGKRCANRKANGGPEWRKGAEIGEYHQAISLSSDWTAKPRRDLGLENFQQKGSSRQRATVSAICLSDPNIVAASCPKLRWVPLTVVKKQHKRIYFSYTQSFA